MSNNLYIGTDVPSKIYIGTQEVSKIYMDTDEIWGGGGSTNYSISITYSGRLIDEYGDQPTTIAPGEILTFQVQCMYSRGIYYEPSIAFLPSGLATCQYSTERTSSTGKTSNWYIWNITLYNATADININMTATSGGNN